MVIDKAFLCGLKLQLETEAMRECFLGSSCERNGTSYLESQEEQRVVCW